MTTPTPGYEQIVNDGFLYINGLNTSYVSSTVLNVSAGQCRDWSNIFDIISNSTITITSSVVGAGGIDTGTIAVSTCYAVYIIFDNSNKNPVNPSALISTNFTQPILPPGYSTYRRVGTWATDSSANFLLARQTGSGSGKTLFYDSAQQVLSAGVATTSTAVSLAACVPPVDATLVRFATSYTPNSAGNVLKVWYSGSTGTVPAIVTGQVSAVATTPQIEQLAALVSGLPKVNYLVTSASDSANLYVAAFTDQL